MKNPRWKLRFGAVAFVSLVGAIIPASHPTPICDAILYLNAMFCIFMAVRV